MTGVAQRAAWSDRTTPPVEEIAEGVWSVPIDFGHAPIRYTFCYLLVTPSGEAVVIDPGGDSILGRAQLEAGLAAAGISPFAIAGVVATHLHQDHLGMVAHVAGFGGAWIGYHSRDLAVLDLHRNGRAQEADRAWLADCGAPPEAVEKIVLDEATMRGTAALPRPTVLLEDGDRLPVAGLDVRVVATPGHTPGHICLVDEQHGLVFSGDHVLPRITPNVGMTSTGGRHGVLDDYYRSLERIAAWPDYEVCPAHEYRFTGLAERARELKQHHRERSAEIVASVGDVPHTVWDIAAKTTWSRPWASFDGVNLRAALGETSAHVDHLVDHGELVAVEGPATTVTVARVAAGRDGR